LVVDILILVLSFRWRDGVPSWEEIEDGGCIDVYTIERNEFCFWMYPEFEDVPIKVYVNDTLYITNFTSIYGEAWFNWNASSEDLHCFKVVGFEGSLWEYSYKPCEFRFAALAEVTPVALYFEVTPSEFKPGDSLTLKANATNPVTDNPLELPLQFWMDTYWLLGENKTRGDGVATWQVLYPSSGVHVYSVTVKEEAAVGNRTLASQPVTLKVGYETELKLWVERGHSNTEHTISGRLTDKSAGTGVGDKTIKITVNGAEYIKTTDSSGYFTLRLDLQPRDEKPTTYQITASFEGDETQIARAYTTTPNGTSYPVCTTMQTVYWPSSNTAALTVESPSTTATADSESTATEQQESTKVEIPPGKTPEEIQQEAEQKGWLKVWHEFSWWYPWYRIHIKININPTIDVGFNPILPGGEKVKWDGLEIFSAVLEEIWLDIALDFLGLFVSYVAAKALGFWNLAAGLIAEGIKGTAQYILLYSDWDNSMKMLATAIANIIMGLIAIKTNIAEAFLGALFKKIYGPAMSAIYLITNKMIVAAHPIQAIRSPIDFVEAGIDFSVGGLALLRYIGLI
jgi:hypothetical protein